MDTGANEELVALGDLHQLARHVDRLSDQARWDELLDLQARCRGAVARGKQLWGIAEWIDYRVALAAPASLAAAAVVEGDHRFLPGPLTEVVASRCTFAELDPHLPPGPARELVAQERVVRGEDLRHRADVSGRVAELPLVLAPWEPAYPVATYHPSGVEAPPPALPRPEPVGRPEPAQRVEDPVTVEALRDLARTWMQESDGHVEATAVAGDAAGAIAALGPPQIRMAPLAAPDALAWCGWAAASGGAHGRRRGMAGARFDVWWAAGALGGFDDLPPDAALGDALGALRWWLWDACEPAGGWRLQLAVEDPDRGFAWALNASDYA